MFVEIDHLSASHINTFITNRPKWYARYFRGGIKLQEAFTQFVDMQ